MTLTAVQTLIVIGLVALSTILTRFLPFVLFSGKRKAGKYIRYLGRMLPYASIGLLVVYCLRNVRFDQPANIVPELVAVLSIVILHYRKENALLSMGVGTAIYMILVNFVF